MASLFQYYEQLISCKLYYFNLHDDYSPFLLHYTTWSTSTEVLPWLVNWNEEQCSESNILIMNHELFHGNSSSVVVYTLPNIITYLNAIKYWNIRLRQIYETNMELKIMVWKTEGWRLLGLLCWKLKTPW